MKLTHFGHSCILVEIDGTRVLFDPGNFSHGFTGITGLDAILVTHQHPDHVDPQALPDLVAANPDAVLLADPQTAETLNRDDVAGVWTAAQSGEVHRIGQITARIGGGKHAVIHSEIPVIDNVAYLLGDDKNPTRFVHPGDSFYAPTQPVDVLAVPSAAPWMRLSEAVDYLRAVAPKVATPIHDAVLSDAGRSTHFGRLQSMAPEATEFRLMPREGELDI